jgi:hypothetical protein
MTVFGAALGLSAGTASGQAGCPAGYVVQEVNFATKTVVCTSLSTKQITSLEAKVAALQAKVTALQAQLASLLTSPNGHYSISVGNTGIELAGPGVSLQLRDSGTAGTPIPTVEVTATKLEMTAGTDTLLTSGRHYLVTTGMDMSMVTGGDVSLDTGGNTAVATSGATSIATGTSAQLSAGSTATIQSANATTIQGGPGATPSSIQVNGSVSISSIHDIEIEAPGDTTIRSTGGLDIFTSVHHIHY